MALLVSATVRYTLADGVAVRMWVQLPVPGVPPDYCVRIITSLCFETNFLNRQEGSTNFIMASALEAQLMPLPPVSESYKDICCQQLEDLSPQV